MHSHMKRILILNGPNLNLQGRRDKEIYGTRTFDDYLAELQARYPEVRWVAGKRFSFRPPRTIQLGEPQPHYLQLALHELGHCLAGHRDFRTDIGRLQLEREAWERAHTVWQELRLKEQGIDWDADFVEAELDTYRDWLHTKSSCPRCGATRFQTIDGVYHCPFCAEFGSRKA